MLSFVNSVLNHITWEEHFLEFETIFFLPISQPVSNVIQNYLLQVRRTSGRLIRFLKPLTGKLF